MKRALTASPRKPARRAAPRAAASSSPRLARRQSPPPSALAHWIARWRGLRVLVWGDFVLDEYWRCLTRRVSREAPVVVLDYLDRTAAGGGAANAALNLAALGARVRAVGLIGDDEPGRELSALLTAARVDAGGLVPVRGASTVVKTRVVAGSVHTALQQVVRIDRGHPFAPGGATAAALAAALTRGAAGARAVVLSDYGYDSVTPSRARPLVARWTADGVVVGLDARYRLAEYRGVSLATPNESEASAAAGMAIDDDRALTRAARRLRRTLQARHLIVTRGRDGLTLWDDAGGSSLEAWGGREAVDVTGAGDAVVATATLALAAGAPPLAAAALATVAGSVAVSRRGAVAVTARELTAALGRGRRR